MGEKRANAPDGVCQQTLDSQGGAEPAEALEDNASWHRCVSRRRNWALSVPVDVVSFPQALDRIVGWGKARLSRYVVLANAHVVVTASKDPTFREAVAGADMAAPDGAPVAWMLRMLGEKAPGASERSGFDVGLIAAVC